MPAKKNIKMSKASDEPINKKIKKEAKLMDEESDSSEDQMIGEKNLRSKKIEFSKQVIKNNGKQSITKNQMNFDPKATTSREESSNENKSENETDSDFKSDHDSESDSDFETNPVNKVIKISEINKIEKNVEIEAKITQIYAKKEIVQKGSECMSLVLEDEEEGNNIKVQLDIWEVKISEIEKIGIKLNHFYLIKNVNVAAVTKERQIYNKGNIDYTLQTTKKTTFKITKEGKKPLNYVKITDLTERNARQVVHIKGVVKEVNIKNGQDYLRKEVIIGQGSETIQLMAWNDISKKLKVEAKDKVYIHNVSVKNYKGTINLTYNENSSFKIK